MGSDNKSLKQPAQIGNVPIHWDVLPLSYFMNRVTYGFTNPMPTTDSGPFKLTAKDIHDGKIDYTTARHTSWEAYYNDLTDKSKPKVGDILLTKDGSIGRVAMCDRADICINQSVALLQPNERIDSRFLKYLLETPHYQRRMENDADGTTIKHIYITRVDKMQIAVPPLDEQKAIAHILGTLDDKIELNQQMNHTLESITRALFKSWFINFDPVRAKMDGRQPTGMDSETAALFPDEFEDSPLGKIPENWKIGRLEEIAEIVMGASPKGDTYNEDGIGIPLVNGPVEFGEYFLVKRKWTTSPTRLSQPGDLVFCVRGSTTGRRVIADDVYCLGRGVCAIRGFKNTQLFVNQTIEIELERLLSKTTGSVFPNLSSSDLREFEVLVPTQSVIEVFCSSVQPLNEEILANIHQIETLKATRDVLLPKLLTGQLQVI